MIIGERSSKSTDAHSFLAKNFRRFTVLLFLAFLWVTVAPSRGETQDQLATSSDSQSEPPPLYVKNVLAELTAPLALVKHSVGNLSTAPVQVIGPNAHRVALIFINPTRAPIAVAANPEVPAIAATITVPPVTGQTAILDESARRPWRAVADRNATAGLQIWEVVR